MSTVEQRIVAAFDGLSPAHQRIGRAVLDDQVAAALSSAESLGRQAGANAATVVRFARAVGFSGWADMREALRAQLPGLGTAVERVAGLQDGRGGARLDEQVVEQDLRNVRETAAANAPETIDAAVASIGSARRVAVVASGLEAPVAELLATALRRAGLDARLVGAPATAASGLDLAELAEGDAIVAIAVWRYIRDTARLFAAGIARGATGVAITDSPVAPVAQQAAIVLLAVDDAPVLSHSMTGLVSLVNVLSARVVAARPADARARLERLDDVFGDLGLISD